MIVAVAVCPHPPALVPLVAAGAAPELDDLRGACARSIQQLVSARPDVVCVAGGGPAEEWYADGAGGSFRSYGVPLDVPLGSAAGGAPIMPLSLTIGAWLLREGGWAGSTCAVSVPGNAADADLSRLGAQLGELAPAVGLLVMGDGSARRSEQAPGYLDPRAAAFDAAVAAALARADPTALAALDPGLGAELLAAGTSPWRLLGRAAAGSAWEAAVLSDVAPYGVGYLVAAWRRQ